MPRVLWGDERAGSVEDVLRALKRRGDGRSTKTDDAAARSHAESLLAKAAAGS